MLTANSPGEVAAWLTPAVRAIKVKMPDAKITVCIPPCTFASGTECAVAGALPEVDLVLTPRSVFSFLAGARPPAGWRPGPKGVVCFLGGDMLYGVLLARRLGYPALAYTEGRARWHHKYSRFLVPDEQAQRRAEQDGAGADQVSIIGDLMLDAVRPCAKDQESSRALLHESADALLLALFPGSRPFEVQSFMPFFSRVAQIVVKAIDKPINVVISLSPFVNPASLQAAATVVPVGYEGVTGAITPMPLPGTTAQVWQFSTKCLNIKVVQGLQYDVMQACDLAVTVPGSNTAEMAYLGVPMVVALPLNRPEDIPLEGLVGLIGNLPLVGPAIKRVAVSKVASKLRFAALPNKKARRQVVPEVRGKLQPADIAIPVVDLLQRPERLQTIRRNLQELMGEAGAAERLATEVLALAAAGQRRGK